MTRVGVSTTTNIALMIETTVQTMSSEAYLQEIKNSLLKSLCLHQFSSQIVERHSKPEIELKYFTLNCNLLFKDE